MFRFWRSIATYRRRMSDGYQRSAVVLSFNHDGLAIARTKKHRRWLPLWHFMVFIYLVLLIRLVVLADIGAVGYHARMAEMENGNILERGAAKVMQLDPISQSLAVTIRGWIR